MKIHKHIDFVYNISNNDYPILLQAHVFAHPLSQYRQSMRSAEGVTADCRLPTANWPHLFLSCGSRLVNIINLVQRA